MTAEAEFFSLGEGAEADTRLPDGSSSLDPARERRVKALTCTEPLHDLQANRSRRNWEAFDFYDLGLAAIDTVVDRMGFDTGISREELDKALRIEALRFAPTYTERKLAPVLTELVETLIRPNVGEYTGAIDEVRRRFDFALLTEHEDGDGRIYLRATNEAINVLVGGLNTDIESAQVAAEATLEHLIRRKRLDDAARPAREAKIRSVQYAMWVRQIIDETKRDIRRAGWHEDVPERLAAIREHLLDRMGTEEKLLDAMQQARDTAVREELRLQAAALVETVDDCFTRHQELHAVTLGAIRVFVEEQDRQVYGRAAAIGAIDLTDEALLPVLAAPVGQVAGIITAFAERLLGFGPGPASSSVTPRLQPHIGQFLVALLRPRPPRDMLGDEVGEPEWAEPPIDPFAFSSEAWAAADEALAELDPPVRLSTLLSAAECDGGIETADLVRLRALVATAPDLEGVRPGVAPVLAASRDGRMFDGTTYAGDDLLVGLLAADEAGYASMVSTDGADGNSRPTRQLRLLPTEPGRRTKANR